MRPIVTREAVESAIKVIKERGERVTIERIWTITGGSPKTIDNIRNAIESGGSNDSNMLSLFNNNAVTGLSYHNVEKRMNTIITKRVNAIVMQQLNTVLTRLEGTEETKESPLHQNQTDDTEVLIEALGEMREMWLDAVGLFSVAGQEVAALDKDLGQLKTRFDKVQQDLSATNTRIAELEKGSQESDRTEKGQRVFKDELALAIRHLVVTVGMPQKEIAELLGISNSEVSKFKNRGTKLRQKK